MGNKTPAEYDGMVQFWVRSMEDFAAIFHDQEYLEKVVPDEKSFLKRDEGIVLIGHEEVKWEDGKAADGVTY